MQFLMQEPGSDVNSPSNYRPISNLNNMNGSSFPASTHALSFPHFIQLQSAYRKMHSCETALCKTLNHIYLSNDDSGKCTLLVSLDLNAAFDTIGHNILLNRLCTRFGIIGSPLAWPGPLRTSAGPGADHFPGPSTSPPLSPSPSLPPLPRREAAPSKAGIRGFSSGKNF